MRAVLYLLGCVTMLAAGMGMALLPRLIPNLWLFMLTGSALTGIIFVSWLLLGATAGSWPRLRTGQVLIVTAIIGGAISMWDADWTALAWSGLILGGGIAFSYPLFGVRPRQVPPQRRSVQPPLGRRQQI